MKDDSINRIHTSQQSTEEGLKNNLEDILDQSNKSIEEIKYEHPTRTITTTFQKPVRGANTYVRFGYGPHKILITPRDKFQYQ